jgi:hypothetical protein
VSSSPATEGFVVLWAGDPTPTEQTLARLLRAQGTRVDFTEPETLHMRADTRAPDLIMFGESTREALEDHLGELRASTPARLIPILLLTTALDSSPKQDSRYGVVARFDHEQAPDTLAQKIHKLLRALSRRPPRWRLHTSTAKLPGWIRERKLQKSEGLLVTPYIGALAIAEGGRLSAPLDELIQTLPAGEQRNVTFYERPPHGIRLLDHRMPPPGATHASLAGARVLVIDERADRGGGIAAALQDQGADVRVCLPIEERIRSNRALDPGAIVVAGSTLLSKACRPLMTEPRLAAATLVILGQGAQERPRPEQILPVCADACETEQILESRPWARRAG